jgi:hypothetical protein
VIRESMASIGMTLCAVDIPDNLVDGCLILEGLFPEDHSQTNWIERDKAGDEAGRRSRSSDSALTSPNVRTGV